MLLNAKIRSPYWDSISAAETRQRIRDYEEKKTHRPTVVVPIIDYSGRALIVRHIESESWGFFQGHIDLDSRDADPVAAAVHEPWEEGSIPPEAIAAVFPNLGEITLPYTEPRKRSTGFTEGNHYILVGIKLKPGASVSQTPPQGYEKAISDHEWCSSFDQAVSILRMQPGVEPVSPRLHTKIERVLIPALENLYLAQLGDHFEFLELT